LTMSSFEKIGVGCQENSPQTRIADVGAYGSTAILAVGPAGILSTTGRTRCGEPATGRIRCGASAEDSQPGETPGCPTGRMQQDACATLPQKIKKMSCLASGN
jgi:hypothetical protein